MQHLKIILVILILFSLFTTFVFANSEPIYIETVRVGSQPTDIVVNPNANYIYVTNYRDNTISVINGSGNIISDTINNILVNGFDINTKTNKLYTNRFLMINGSDNTKIPTTLIDPISYSLGVAVNSRTNTVYITNIGDNTISVFSGSNNNIIYSTIKGIGNMPVGIVVNSKTNTIYVANQGSDNVSVIDGTNNTISAMIKVGSAPQGIAVNPNTNTIYVVNSDSNSVSVINGITNTVNTTIGVGNFPWGIAVNPSTNTIYVANRYSNTISVIDGISNEVINTIAVGNAPWNIAVNPNSNIVYVTNNKDNTVSIITNPNSTLNTQANKDPFEILKKTVNDKMDSIFARLDVKYNLPNNKDYCMSDNYTNFLTSVENKIDVLLKSGNLSERNKVILNEVKSRIEKRFNSLCEML